METICSITNPLYRFENAKTPKTQGYLIVGELNHMAILNQYGDRFMTPEEAIKTYQAQKITVHRVFTEGEISLLAELRHKADRKPLDEAIKFIEEELLKK